MTTVKTAAPAAPPATTPTSPLAHRQTLRRVVASEWIKLRTLRATWIGLGAVLLLMIGLGAIAAAVSTGSVTAPDDSGPGLATSDALETALTGATFGVLLLGILGCLAGAREYGSRMITATVAATPRRWQIVVAKALTLTAVVLPTALVGVFAAFGVSMAVLSGGGAATVALGDDGVFGAVFGMGFYLTAVALIGMALGILLRSVASSIGVLIAGLLVLPGIGSALLPDSLDGLLQLLPANAASSFTAVSGESTMGSLAGVLTIAGWVVVGLISATVTITRRDV